MIPPYQEHWDFYMSNVDGKLASISLDLGLRDIGPLKETPSILWVQVPFLDPTDKGFNSNEESEALWAIEDHILEQLKSIGTTVFSGRVSSNGERLLYYYIEEGKEQDLEALFQDIQASFPNYKLAHGTQDDRDWSHFFEFMMPDEEEITQMQNRSVVRTLEEQGDDLSTPRSIHHWLYFKSKKDAEAFLEITKKDGFILVEENSTKENEEFSHQIQISRKDSVHYSDIDRITGPLTQLATTHNGIYDGWECEVIKTSLDL